MERNPRSGAVNARRRSRLAAAAFLVACLLIAGAARPARALTPAGEYEVKAAFLVNFAGFVRWPAAAFANAASPFVVCVAGDDPFGAAFEPFKQIKVAGRSLVVQPIDSTATLPGSCHILFVAGSETPRLPGILGALGKARGPDGERPRGFRRRRRDDPVLPEEREDPFRDQPAGGGGRRAEDRRPAPATLGPGARRCPGGTPVRIRGSLPLRAKLLAAFLALGAAVALAATGAGFFSPSAPHGR